MALVYRTGARQSPPIEVEEVQLPIAGRVIRLRTERAADDGELISMRMKREPSVSAERTLTGITPNNGSVRTVPNACLVGGAPTRSGSRPRNTRQR